MGLNYTKGNWNAEEEYNGWRIISYENEIGESKSTVIAQGMNAGYDMGESDAKLVAAAPQLLSALIELRKVVEMGESYAPALQKAKEAIKKATE